MENRNSNRNTENYYDATVVADNTYYSSYPPPVQPPYEPPSYYQPNYTPEPPRKNNKGLIIGIVSASVVAVAAIVIAILIATGVLGGNKNDNDDKDDKPRASVTQTIIETTTDYVPVPVTNFNNPVIHTQPAPQPEPQPVPQPNPVTPVNSLTVGNDYTYIPVSLTESGYDKMVAAVTFLGDVMYLEVDYNGYFGNSGGVIYAETLTTAINIVVDSQGYYEVYAVDIANGNQVYNITEESEVEDIEYYTILAYLMGFDIDKGFYELFSEMPPHYTYLGQTTHTDLGTVDVFTFEVNDAEYEIWVDTETGATARLYEDGEIILETSSLYADNALDIVNYAN